jgi:hypothetical protein
VKEGKNSESSSSRLPDFAWSKAEGAENGMCYFKGSKEYIPSH